jgi:hypothetical protein
MQNNAYESSQVYSGGSRKTVRRILVTCLYLLVTVSGMVQAIRPQSVVIALLWVMFASTVTYWCVVDSRAAGRPILQSLHWIIFFTWPIAVPIYLIFSRKLRGLGIAFLHAICLLVVTNLAFHISGYLVYGELWFQNLR